jgi:hypothetical protein
VTKELEETEIEEAEIEHRNYAVAYCPKCNAEHDVSTCGSGTEECICGTKFYWSTEV